MYKNELTKYCYKSTATEKWIDFLNHTPHFNISALGSIQEKNALCIPDCGKVGSGFCGGVFSYNKTPVVSSFQREGMKTANQLLKLIESYHIKYDDQEVVYLGQYRNQWGSFLVDSISRLWFALKEPQKYKYVFLATQTALGGMHKNSYEFLRLFGIAKEQIIYVTEPVQFKSMIIPEMAYIPMGTYGKACCWHREYLEVIKKVVAAVPCEVLVNGQEKVYFSRGKFSQKQKSDYGEELITEMMLNNGFYVVYPEEHTLQEQIAIVNRCKIFASVGGSCAHNIIFSQTKPKMILFNRMNGYQWHQWMLDEMAGVEPITYVDTYCEPYWKLYKTEISGPYLYWLNSNLKNFAKDYNLYVPKGFYVMMRKMIILMRYTLRVIHEQSYKLKKKVLE